MSTEITERPLRIERLESRSLLAAGIFEFLAERDNSDRLHDARNFQDKFDRPVAVAVASSFRGNSVGNTASGEALNARRLDSFGRNIDRPILVGDRAFSNRDVVHTREQVASREPVSNRSQIPSHNAITSDNVSPSSPLSTSVRVESSVNTNLFVRPVSTVVVLISERPSTSSTVARSVAPQSTPASANALPLTQGSPSTLRASDTLVQKTELGTESGVSVETSTVDQAQTQDNSQMQAAESGPRQLAKLQFGSASASTKDGYIELLPLWKTDPLQSESETKDWTIDSNIIPQIRNALQSPLYRTPELADLAMRDWFAGPGGLIDLDHGGSPALFLPVPSELINVELESIVGLHRSLDLIAAGVTEPISGPMLEAILASIEDITASESQPISEAAPFRLPTMAYPALAVIASGVTIAAHRRRSHLSHPEVKDADE